MLELPASYLTVTEPELFWWGMEMQQEYRS